MKRTYRIAAVIAACVVALPSPASAQESAKAGPSTFTVGQQQEAEDRWKEGRALYEDGKVDAARLKYAQAFAVLQRTNILWNLAIAEFYSDRPLDSLRHFKLFVQRTDAEPADVKRADEKYIPEAMRLTGHLTIDAAPGLEITVDEELQPGATPFRDTVDVAPGPHKVFARYKGKTEAKEVTCAAGRTLVVKFEMQTAEPGKRELVAAYPRARTYVTLALGAGALAAVGVGAVLAVSSQSRDDENREFIQNNPQVCVDRASSGCAGWQDRLDGQQTSATAAKILYVTGGVLAAGAVVAWFGWPKPKLESGAKRAWIAPSFAPGAGGVSMGGTF